MFPSRLLLKLLKFVEQLIRGSAVELPTPQILKNIKLMVMRNSIYQEFVERINISHDAYDLLEAPHHGHLLQLILDSFFAIRLKQLQKCLVRELQGRPLDSSLLS
jgi:hypothetical protein